MSSEMLCQISQDFHFRDGPCLEAILSISSRAFEGGSELTILMEDGQLVNATVSRRVKWNTFALRFDQGLIFWRRPSVDLKNRSTCCQIMGKLEALTKWYLHIFLLVLNTQKTARGISITWQVRSSWCSSMRRIMWRVIWQSWMPRFTGHTASISGIVFATWKCPGGSRGSCGTADDSGVFLFFGDDCWGQYHLPKNRCRDADHLLPVQRDSSCLALKISASSNPSFYFRTRVCFKLWVYVWRRKVSHRTSEA